MIVPVLGGLLPLLGLAIGSFLNVVIHRVPIGASVVRPRSACPGCGGAITVRDNVPVLSWLLLRGRCRTCSTPIPARYPAVEALTGLAFVVVGLAAWPRIRATDGAAELLGALVGTFAYLYLAAISVALAAIDLDVRRLPDAIVLPAYAVGGGLLTAAAILAGEPTRIAGALFGAAASWAFYRLLAALRPGGMGMGDVKLAGVLGLFLGALGPQQLVVGVFAAFLLGGFVGIGVLLASRGGRGRAIPFGPWMLAGAWIGILSGEALASSYLRITGLGA